MTFTNLGGIYNQPLILWMNVFTQTLRHCQDATQCQFLKGKDLNSCLASRLVALPRLKNPVCSTTLVLFFMFNVRIRIRVGVSWLRVKNKAVFIKLTIHYWIFVHSLCMEILQKFRSFFRVLKLPSSESIYI